MARKSNTETSTATIGFEAKLWLAADKLRNNMDAAEYKHVVLGLIFLKYISDTFEKHRAKLLAGEGDYAGANPVLLVCEEAHRYVPNRGEAQYEAAQEAIRRIAKEGRKYGIGLLLVSQRPSEVEATVLSQCNSWIILRITNDADREHVRAILPDSMAGLTKMLSGLRRQEAIFVGQAAILPSRILIRSLTKEQLPRSNDIDFDKGWQGASMTAEELGVIANRWRFQQR